VATTLIFLRLILMSLCFVWSCLEFSWAVQAFSPEVQKAVGWGVAVLYLFHAGFDRREK
jgi:predicted membrane protein